jgi:hypothetical protein
MLRRFAVLSVMCIPGAALAAEGDPCTADAFASTCNGDEITFCGALAEGDPNTELVFNCSTEFYTDGTNPITVETFTCVEPGTTGTPPAGFEAQCWGEGAGAQCQGVLGLIAQGADALLIGCAPGFSCTLGADAEACAAAPSPCTASGLTCNGDLLTLCLGNDAFAFVDPMVADCAALGGACRTEGEFTGCFGAEGGLCSVVAVGAVCDDGFECIDGGQGLGSCVAEGEGEGEGDPAACDADADCGAGETCTDGSCVAPTDDDAECDVDSDCGDGETCDDGSCTAPPPALLCASMTTSQSVPFAGLAFVGLLVRLVGRRRST